jgi:hypothetical protein
MQIRMTIDTTDATVAGALFPNAQPEFIDGARHGIGEGMVVECIGIEIRHPTKTLDTLTIVITDVTAEKAGHVANWLSTTLQERRVRLQIDQQTVNIDKDKIEETIVSLFADEPQR